MKALDGVRVLDMTHVQSGPTCTQLLAWFGADVIKVERPGSGDATRGQLRDVPNADSLYFTMLNGNTDALTMASAVRRQSLMMPSVIINKILYDCSRCEQTWNDRNAKIVHDQQLKIKCFS